MIKKSKSLSMAESLGYIEPENKEIISFINKFVSLDSKEAQKLREEILGLEFLKISDRAISQIIDLMPENEEDLNKVFSDMKLDENESKTILDTIKKYK